MYLGAASMIGTTGAGYSGNIPHEFDVLTYTNEDLKEVSNIGYTVHNIVISDPTVYTEKNIKFIPQLFEKVVLLPFGIQSTKLHPHTWKEIDYLNFVKKF